MTKFRSELARMFSEVSDLLPVAIDRRPENDTTFLVYRDGVPMADLQSDPMVRLDFDELVVLLLNHGANLLARLDAAEKALAAAHDGMPLVQCPRCGAIHPDFDGFGFVAHVGPSFPDSCGYCTHPARNGRDDGAMVCRICGDVEPAASEVPS